MADNKNVNNAPEDDADFITLQFEDSEDIECEILGVFECEGQEYIALLPDDGTDDVYIYGYKEDEFDDENFELIDIEDDDEFDRVAAEFERLSLED